MNLHFILIVFLSSIFSVFHLVERSTRLAAAVDNFFLRHATMAVAVALYKSVDHFR